MSDEKIRITGNTVEGPPLRLARDTLTVCTTVYHQPAGEEPTAVSVQYVRPLEFQEQPYVRKIKVGEQWQPLDLGWIEQPGMILLVNDEGKFSQTNPTDEERAEAAAKIVEVGWEDSWLVPPQGFILGTPSKPGTTYMRCQSGTARVTIHVYPR